MLIYSEQGLDALIRPVFGSVCQALIVVSYWTPGSPQRLAARLDRAGRRVGAAHERHRSARVAALRELLLRGAQLRQIHARARAAAEDHALAADPVEDRLHRVLDREDEARGALRLRL